MKAKFFLIINIGLVAAGALAQSYSIDWHTISAGDRSSSSGDYSLRGSIGQPDAGGTISGASFSMTGGFWSIVPMTEAPSLTIVRTNGGALGISWPSTAVGFSLQQNANLSAASWATPAEVVTDNGTSRFIIVNPPAGNRYYRLFKP